MGCTQSSAAAAGPKVFPADATAAISSESRPATTPAATVVFVTTTTTNTGETTTTPALSEASDFEIAAKAQQEDIAYSSADQVRQQRVALFRASKDGDPDAVRAALDQGANVNARGMWDNTPLICACQYGFADVASVLLLKDSCDVNAVNEKGCTALHHAAIESLSSVVAALLKRGANPRVAPAKLYNEKMDQNETLDPLSAAIAASDLASVRAITSALSSAESTSDAGASAIVSMEAQSLSFAISRGATESIEPVLSLCVKMQIKSVVGEASDSASLLMQACDAKSEATAIALLESLKSFNIMSSEYLAQQTILTTKACEQEMVNFLKLLLDAGVSVDEKTLALAQKINNPEIIALLPANPQ
jgi:ankyrin repeat protein